MTTHSTLNAGTQARDAARARRNRELGKSVALHALLIPLALLFLAPVALRLLRDYDRQRRAGSEEPMFDRHADPVLDAKLPEEVWR